MCLFLCLSGVVAILILTPFHGYNNVARPQVKRFLATLARLQKLAQEPIDLIFTLLTGDFYKVIQTQVIGHWSSDGVLL